MRYFFLLFVLTSLAEVMVFIQVGEWLGMGLTIISVIATAAIGVSLLRIQGLKTLQKVQQKTAQGEIPGQELVEGVLLLIAGALLLTPGFLTDGLGFLILSPFSRSRIAAWLLRKGLIHRSQWSDTSSTTTEFNAVFRQKSGPAGPRSAPRNQSERRPDSQTIDGEYQRKD